MNKIIGGLLLVLGTGIIVITLFHSYRIFTGAVPVPEVFETEESLEANIEQENPEALGPEGLIQQKLQEQIGRILPINAVMKLLNLMSWSIFSTIAMFGGSKIGQLGIKSMK